MKQEESLITLTKIISSSEYEFESKTSIGFSPLSVYTSWPLTLLPLSLLLIDSPSLYHYNNMSQHNLHQIIRQQ